MVKRVRKYPRIEDTKINYKFIVLVAILIFSFLLFLSFLVEIPKQRENETISENGSQIGYSGIRIEENFFSSQGSTRVKMYLPAVDAEGKGVNTILTVEAGSGSGRTLTDIDNLLFWADTQHSIRVARKVAENITKKQVEDYDIVYTIEANASVIGGPSAGAALAIATIAALEGKRLNNEVMITGSINHDGSIGPVSNILEKAVASKDVGAKLFLVPLLQSGDIIYETEEHCEVFGKTKICTTETKPIKVDVKEKAGIDVKEIGSVQEAMKYFFK